MHYNISKWRNPPHVYQQDVKIVGSKSLTCLVHIIAGSDAGLVNCALLQVLGRLEDFGADQPDRGEETRFPWWDQELPAETSRSQVVQNLLLEDHNHIPDKRSLHCFSDNNWTRIQNVVSPKSGINFCRTVLEPKREPLIRLIKWPTFYFYHLFNIFIKGLHSSSWIFQEFCRWTLLPSQSVTDSQWVAVIMNLFVQIQIVLKFLKFF